MPVLLAANGVTLLAGVAALVSALAAAIGAALGFRNKQKIQEVHVIVNSKMTDALDRVKTLEDKMRLSPGEPIPGAQIVTAGTPAAPPADIPSPASPAPPTIPPAEEQALETLPPA